MKKTFQLVLILLFPLWMSAQDCPEYFPLSTGSSWEITSYNKKDKVDAVNSYVVKSKTDTTNGYKAVVGMTSADDKGKTTGAGDLIMKCAAGVFYFDMKNFLDQSTMEQNKDMDVTMTSTDMAFPATLSEGGKLPDANITYQISANGMVVMTMTVNITERKVVGKENMTTPAGSFEVWKISSKFQSKSGFMTVKLSTVDYISFGAGIVKTESYNEKGELMSYTILTKLSKL
ncbi:hypothetical protein SDC9_46760 [bioreactor metagenome]|uniref:DUF3108 domain-containing protein n=1 Tax=bioreactor metagenome TaxID=1076179 RepID=A0A644WDX9_9ZZZZ